MCLNRLILILQNRKKKNFLKAGSRLVLASIPMLHYMLLKPLYHSVYIIIKGCVDGEKSIMKEQKEHRYITTPINLSPPPTQF